MIKAFGIALTILCCVLMADAQEKLDCAGKISNINTSTSVRVVKHDSTIVNGEFLSLAGDVFLLNRTPTEGQNPVTESIPLKDIWKIKYEKPGSIKVQYILLGALVGGIVGIPVGQEASKGKGLSGIGDGLGAWTACAGGGIVLGTVLPLLFHSSETIRCK